MNSVKFGDLWVGDRFVAYGSLWTCIDRETARKHGSESINLLERGYGYVGDTLCSFEPNSMVNFVPPNKI